MLCQFLFEKCGLSVNPKGHRLQRLTAKSFDVFFPVETHVIRAATRCEEMGNEIRNSGERVLIEMEFLSESVISNGVFSHAFFAKASFETPVDALDPRSATELTSDPGQEQDPIPDIVRTRTDFQKFSASRGCVPRNKAMLQSFHPKGARASREQSSTARTIRDRHRVQIGCLEEGSDQAHDIFGVWESKWSRPHSRALAPIHLRSLGLTPLLLLSRADSVRSLVEQPKEEEKKLRFALRRARD